MCLVVGFEVDEFDSLLMKFVNVLHKLQPISSHVLINCVGTAKLIKLICNMHVNRIYHINMYVLLNQLDELTH